MKTVGLVWTPSASTGVDGQVARIVNPDTLEVYGEAQLAATEDSYSCPVPEGAVCQGSVTTIRGSEDVTVLSAILKVGYLPLQGVTNLDIGIVDSPSIDPVPQPK